MSVVIIWFGVLALALGAAGAFADSEIWWVFALLGLSGVLMVYGGVTGIARWRRAVRAEAENTRAMLGAVSAVPGDTTGLPAPVLAHWTYEPGEWTAYAAREVAFRRREAAWVGLGVVALGTLLLGWTEGDWALAFGVSLVIGAAIGVGRWLVARSAHRSNLAAPRGDVIISPNAILMNGRYHVLQDENFTFGGVRYLEDERPPILEFTVTWPTRSGRTNEQYRVPVPRGREDEARALAAAFEHERLLAHAPKSV
ncbi:MAG TPA: hypothetical protein VF746_17210 [Longimicrobium sp.]